MTEQEQNAERYHRLVEGFMNGRDYAVVDELVSPDVKSHDPFPGQPAGLEGLKQTFAMFHRAFPDLQAEVELVVANDDMVAARCHVTGTHKGEFMGRAATGKAVSYSEAVFLKFHDGMIVEHWAVADVMNLMEAISA